MASERVAWWQVRMIESSAASCPIPSFSITRRDLTFVGTVNATISSRSRILNPYRAIAKAPSVARPCPQWSAASRHPISTHGVKCAWNEGTNKANKVSVVPTLRGAEPESVLLKVRLNSINH